MGQFTDLSDNNFLLQSVVDFTNISQICISRLSLEITTSYIPIIPVLYNYMPVLIRFP